MDVAGRLAMLPRHGVPLDDIVDVHWDAHQIPFIQAATDHDLALVLGIVHVHLRWTQMELMRHVAHGRVAELVGPFGVRLDRALRTLDISRAAAAIAASLPPATRAWAETFVAGINHAVNHLPLVPREFRLLGLARREWTLTDVVGVGRLAALDVTWIAWLALLRDWRGDQPETVWRRLTNSPPALDIALRRGRGADTLRALLQRFGRFGSNSLAVGPARTRSGSPCIASDTHLPALLPNLWLIAGYRSPSYHAVGLMVPGVPAILLGRNPWLAWGGTNLHAASSDLFDVSRLAKPAIRRRRERLHVRFCGSRRIAVRETAYGPVVSDLRPSRGGKAYALRWMGHRPSDELTAMLAVNRARDWQAFRAAIDGIAVPGQNMVYADVAGHIGKAMAVHLPVRKPARVMPLLLPMTAAAAWDHTVRGSELPATVDPADGFVASANDPPPDAPVLIGHLFSSDHRVKRLRQVLRASHDWDAASLASLQQDAWLPAALPIRDLLLSRLRLERGKIFLRLAETLRPWHGDYAAGSAGALTFELLLYHLGLALHGRRQMQAFAAVWNARELLFRNLAALPPDVLSMALRGAAWPALRDLRRFGTWGSMHRLEPRHILAAMPVLGCRYRVAGFAADGGSDTVLKTAYPLTNRRHCAGLASTARHISDLANLDDNRFVLLGGQDGWAGSTTATDQIALWRAGRYIHVPLSTESVRAAFRFHTVLRP